MSERQPFSVRGAGNPPPTQIGPLRAVWGSRTYIAAIANLTPDSFSGDGLYAAEGAGSAAALDRIEQHARDAVRDGADLLDLGAESTRPGHEPVDAREELARLLPAIERLRRSLPNLALSVDTQKPEVAEAALAAGAHLINDIWGTRSGDEMLRVAADRRVPIVVMHNRPAPRGGADGANFAAELVAELASVSRRATELGIPRERLILDPGFGFGKTPAQNLVALRAIGTLRDLGHPLLLGTSRKSTLGRIVDGAPGDRLAATVATSALGALAGADILRVHDIAENRDAALVVDALLRAGGSDPAESLGPDPSRLGRPPRPAQRDKIVVRGLRFDAAHGVLPEEHRTAQPFFVDVELDLDLAPAGLGDDLSASVDYGAIVAAVVRRVGGGGHADLIEALAERVAAGVADAVGASGVSVAEVRVRVRKPLAPVGAQIDWAGVEIVRRP